MTWIALATRAPAVGEWVLIYLTAYAGVDRYRAGIYMGPDDWMSAANVYEGKPLLADSAVSHWMPLPKRPEGSNNAATS